jgi:predicted ATP-grasp superfamily ATP-dependent carboligase
MVDPAGAPRLEHVRWRHRPRLEAPVLVAAFAGWNDAGDAATTAVRAINEAWGAEEFADLDAELFYDFTSTRPRVEFADNGEREVVWPANVFSAATVPGTDLDVITLVGVEPELRWRTFSEQITGVAGLFGARMVVTLGALLAEVPHTRPVSIFGTGHDHETTARLGLLPSSYEGPTGITGVVATAGRAAGMSSVSFWAAVPTYVPSAPSPKAALALVERTGRLLDAAVDTADLAEAAEEYEREVSEVAADDEETLEYLRALEHRYDEEGLDVHDDPGRLVEEVERFLRDQD